MTEQIVLTIDPENGSCCAAVWGGEKISGCEWWDDGWCKLFEENAVLSRCPRCLAAARTLREEREAARRVIEAGHKFADREQFAHGKTDEVTEWDAAVAQYEAARGEGR